MERLILCAWSVALIVGTVALVGHEFNEVVGPIWRRFCRHRQFSTVGLLEGMTVLSVAFGLTRMAALATGTTATVVVAWPVAMHVALGVVLGCETIAGEAAALLRRHAKVPRQQRGSPFLAEPAELVVRVRRYSRRTDRGMK